MSAFEVDKTHIDVLVSAALAAGKDFYWYHQPADAPRTEPGERLPGESSADRYAAYLAGLAENKREVTRANAGMWGAVLVAENKRSVNHRYDEDDEWEEPYEFTCYAGPFDPVAILKAVNCYEYQAGEHPGWKTSEAREFCEALRGEMIRHLPGYSSFAREVTDVSQVRPRFGADTDIY